MSILRYGVIAQQGSSTGYGIYTAQQVVHPSSSLGAIIIITPQTQHNIHLYTQYAKCVAMALVAEISYTSAIEKSEKTGLQAIQLLAQSEQDQR